MPMLDVASLLVFTFDYAALLEGIFVLLSFTLQDINWF